MYTIRIYIDRETMLDNVVTNSSNPSRTPKHIKLIAFSKNVFRRAPFNIYIVSVCTYRRIHIYMYVYKVNAVV